MNPIATKVGALVSTVLLATGTLALSAPTAAAANDVEISQAVWSTGAATISAGEEKNAKFTIRNNTKDTLKITVTPTITVSCDVKVVVQRSEPIVVGPNSTSGPIDDATIRGGSDCKNSTLRWTARYNYVGTTEKPKPSSATPTPTLGETTTSDTPPAAEVAPSSAAPTVLTGDQAKKEEDNKSGGLALPFLLAFLGLLILALAGGILYFAQKQRTGEQ